MTKQRTKILRVGFDLDGVLLYNPARIARPIIVFLKKLFLPSEQNKFHLPKNKIQKIIWLILHKSSFIIAPGFQEIKDLIKNKKIQAYIISARYESLKSDFYKWLKIMEADKYFLDSLYNSNNEQPYIFKAKTLNKLKIDYFIEDNYDIASYLFKHSKTKILWIYNILDRKLKFPNKFPTLKSAVQEIKQNLNTLNRKPQKK